MSERFSQFVPENPPASLFDYAAVVAWFGIPAAPEDPKILAGMSAVTKAIRSYTGRVINEVAVVETFEEVGDFSPYRHLREVPVTIPPTSTSGGISSPSKLLNSQTGWTKIPVGSIVQVSYTGGCSPVPDDLKIVFMSLLAMQMSALEVEGFGKISSPQERAVTIGQLKVDYSLSAESLHSQAATAGGISAEALAPWAFTLDQYRYIGTMVAT